MAIKFADTARPNNSTTEAKGTFPIAMGYDVWLNNGDSVEEAIAAIKSIQVSTFPTATVDNLGTIYQYIGTTNQDYTNGLFYQCQIVDDGQGGVAYAWVEKEVQGSIKISQEADNQIEEKSDGIYVAPQTNALVDVGTLPTGNDIEDTFYRTKDSLIQIYFGDSLESSLAVFDEWIQNGYVTKDTIGDDTVIEAATGYSIYFVDSLGNKVAANSFKYTVESPFLTIYWYDTSDEEHLVGFINMTSGTPYYDNKYWCVPNVANNIYAGDSTAHTTTPIPTSADIKTYTAGNGIDITNDVISSESVIFTGTTDEWEQLSSADKAKYTHTCFTDDESGEFDIYSTSETKTNKKWIDGKPIYRKVISTDVTTYSDNDSRRQFEVELIDANAVDELVNVYGNYKIVASSSQSLNYTYALFSVAYSNNMSGYMGTRVTKNPSTNKIEASFGIPVAWGWTKLKVNAVLEYTKTTD